MNHTGKDSRTDAACPRNKLSKLSDEVDNPQKTLLSKHFFFKVCTKIMFSVEFRLQNCECWASIQILLDQAASSQLVNPKTKSKSGEVRCEPSVGCTMTSLEPNPTFLEATRLEQASDKEEGESGVEGNRKTKKSDDSLAHFNDSILDVDDENNTSIPLRPFGDSEFATARNTPTTTSKQNFMLRFGFL